MGTVSHLWLNREISYKCQGQEYKGKIVELSHENTWIVTIKFHKEQRRFYQKLFNKKNQIKCVIGDRSVTLRPKVGEKPDDLNLHQTWKMPHEDWKDHIPIDFSKHFGVTDGDFYVTDAGYKDVERGIPKQGQIKTFELWNEMNGRLGLNENVHVGGTERRRLQRLLDAERNQNQGLIR